MVSLSVTKNVIQRRPFPDQLLLNINDQISLTIFTDFAINCYGHCKEINTLFLRLVHLYPHLWPGGSFVVTAVWRTW